MKFYSVLVTGGAGYVGSLLVPQLLARGHKVTVFDTMYFGNGNLPTDHPRLKLVKGDIRDTAHLARELEGIEAVVNMACISNDASFELDESLSTTINLDAFEPMVLAAKKAGVKRFIYASSSSVYGVSDQPDVTEDHPLLPLTLYNKYKGMCEPLLLKHTDDKFVGVIFRPATVCGYAPHQRLDLSVNILTNHAVTNGKIKVFGGDQMRPNLHVQDYCDAVLMFLDVEDDLIRNQIFNVGFQNMSIRDLALLVKKVVEEEFPEKGEIGIETTLTNDNRSYHINSDKVTRAIGFKPRHTIEEAIRDLCRAFKLGALPNSMEDDQYYNVRTLKKIQAK
jgi:nucleoside-diphosphate-sugar epimerase